MLRCACIQKVQERQHVGIVNGLMVGDKLSLMHHPSLSVIPFAASETTLIIAGPMGCSLFLDGCHL